MKVVKPYFLAANSKKAQATLKSLKVKYKHYTLQNSNVVVVLGGDGTMLSLINHKEFLEKKIFGINRGTIGFLMNNYHSNELTERIIASKETLLKAIQMKVTDIHNKTHQALSLNEVSLLRQNRYAANVKVKINNKIKINKLVCDGILVSTPAGSTAYNLSAHGPILPLNSTLLALTPICPFRPRRWRGAILPEKSKIIFEIINAENRPVSATAGQVEVRNVKKVEVSYNLKKTLKLLFDKDHNLEEKILNEQFIL